jgi:hypothetical protein
MTLAESIAIAVSITALLVAIASAVIAWRAKEQAKKAATLEPRTMAINHIHQAHFDVTNNGYVTGKTVNSIHEARKIAARVFSREIRTELDRAHATATQLNVANPLETQHSPDIIKLGKDLQTLITRMNNEAALVG